VITGALLFWLALGWAASAAAGGHGSYLPAKVVIPLRMVIALASDFIGTAALLVGALQLPICGAVLGSGPTRRSLVRRAAALFLAHAAAAVAATPLAPLSRTDHLIRSAATTGSRTSKRFAFAVIGSSSR